jgi:flagellar assembly factor FliW
MGGKMIKVHTTRFGALDVNEQDIIRVPEGILGFDTLKKFFIVDPADDTLILWLQSVDSQDIAFPILEPKVFKPDYKVRLSASELRSLQLDSVAKKETLVYCILTIPDDVTGMTANLKAPIVINAKEQVGRQVVLQENEYSVKYSIYKELMTVIMSITGQRNKPRAEQSQGISIAPLELRTASSKVEVIAL